MSPFFHLRRWLLPLPLLGLLAVTYWLNEQVQPELAKMESSKRHDPNAIVENFSATRLNDKGTPRFIISANKMLHFPDDSTTLEMPHLTSLSAEHPAIHARAKHGTLSNKGDEIFLHGNVEIVREASTRQDQLTLRTEYLHLLPDQDLADTDRAVTVVDTRNTVYATGMQMDTRARTIKLLSQAKSEFFPHEK